MQTSKNPLKVLCMLLVCSNNALAESENIVWSGEVYGGRYYDDKRLGTYLVLSNESTRGPTVIGELLLEHYTTYEFAGIGGHVLWPIEPLGDVGFFASQAWESYEYNESGENQKLHYKTRTLGVEWELEKERLAIAAQVGKYNSGYDDINRNYVSADLYFWGPELNWYLRGATRWISNDSFHLIEGYRTFDIQDHPVTAYIGVGDDLKSVSVEAVDSVYAGAYVEILSNRSSTLTLWAEATQQEGETLFTLELNLAFDPGARKPYITAFGFSLND